MSVIGIHIRGQRSTESTNINIEPYFEKEIDNDNNNNKCKRDYCIRVHLTPPAVNYEKRIISSFIIQLTRDDFFLYENKSVSVPITVDMDWTPKSHMRDFQWMQFNMVEQEIIARGQGIGVIIIEPLEIYVKLIYDSTTPCGVRAAGHYGITWNHSSQSKRMLYNDLSIGFDVLLQTIDGTVHSLCESFDTRDTQETPILFSEYECYAHYQHPSPHQ